MRDGDLTKAPAKHGVVVVGAGLAGVTTTTTLRATATPAA